MDSFTQSLLDHAAKNGADLIGIAPIERFNELTVTSQHHPSSIFPEAKSVIVLGRRITRGTLRGLEEGTQFELYRMYGYGWLEDRFLSMLTFKMSEFLENNRWEAVPLFNLPAETPTMGIPVRKGQPAPNVLMDFDDAAVRAGLGEISYLRVFLSKKYGPRQRFQIILTDAVLEGTPISNEPICKPNKDMKQFCPLNAIDTSKEETLRIAGKDMKLAQVDYSICRNCRNGAFPNRYFPSAPPDRLGALCVRSLMDYLEKHQCIENGFENPFRKRQPWKVMNENLTVISNNANDGGEIE